MTGMEGRDRKYVAALMAPPCSFSEEQAQGCLDAIRGVVRDWVQAAARDAAKEFVEEFVESRALLSTSGRRVVSRY